MNRLPAFLRRWLARRALVRIKALLEYRDILKPKHPSK